MEKGFPVANEDLGIEKAMKYLKDSPALLVEEYGRIVGIVTRYDVLDVQL
jgi:predicted transcriptional regulator